MRLLLLLALLGHWRPWATSSTQATTQLSNHLPQIGGRRPDTATFVNLMNEQMDCSHSMEQNSIDLGSFSFDDEDFMRIDSDLRRNYNVPQAGDRGCEVGDLINPKWNKMQHRDPGVFLVVKPKSPQPVKSEKGVPFALAQRSEHSGAQNNRKIPSKPAFNPTEAHLKHQKSKVDNRRFSPKQSRHSAKEAARSHLNKTKLLEEYDIKTGRSDSLNLRHKECKVPDSPVILGAARLLSEAQTTTIDGDQALSTTTEITTTGVEETTTTSSGMNSTTIPTPRNPTKVKILIDPSSDQRNFNANGENVTSTTVRSKMKTPGRKTFNKSSKNPINNKGISEISTGKGAVSSTTPVNNKNSIDASSDKRNFNSNGENVTSTTVRSKMKTTGKKTFNKISKNPIDSTTDKSAVSSTTPANNKNKGLSETTTDKGAVSSTTPVNTKNRATKQRTMQKPITGLRDVKVEGTENNGSSEIAAEESSAQKRRDKAYKVHEGTQRNQNFSREDKNEGNHNVRAQSSSGQDLCANQGDSKTAEDDLSSTGSNCHEFFTKPRFRSKLPKKTGPAFNEPLAFETSLHSPVPEMRGKRPRNPDDCGASDVAISKSDSQEYSAPYDSSSYGKSEPDYLGVKENHYRDEWLGGKKQKHPRPPTVKLNKIVPRRPPPQQQRPDPFGKRIREFKIVPQHPQLCEDELDLSENNDGSVSADYGHRKRYQSGGDRSSDYRDSEDYGSVDYGKRPQSRGGGDRSSDYRDSEDYVSVDYGKRSRSRGGGDRSSDYRDSEDYGSADYGKRPRYRGGGDRSSDYKDSEDYSSADYGNRPRHQSDGEHHRPMEPVRPACPELYGYPRQFT